MFVLKHALLLIHIVLTFADSRRDDSHDTLKNVCSSGAMH
jgi:hypothetical protein